ncbi:FadR/GntR family transcriptional regulator [Microlunatus soli]|uniref:DNA-binding transcriptional regulator, FadR family n=1 Tax=Microlunatus soli TaxID=630515 RepID=A0A1H1YQM2_9ACTN|nr:FadR/GntR family transcriptional regulator [Microlunatus soli]SDT23713.1 DNA-binding transcriptional regulator, FadR family [Microlunatus soli]
MGTPPTRRSEPAVPQLPPTSLRTAPLHKSVQDEIRHFIVREGLRAGDPLKPEAELARLFGVGRNSVREAVKALESTGVLETRRGSGVFVRDFSFEPLLDHLPYGLMRGPRALADLVGLRKTLETALIGDAIGTLSKGHREELRQLVRAMREAVSRGEGLIDLDRAFHQLLYVDLGNAMLLQLFDLFWQAYHRAAPASPHREPTLIVDDHAAIADAVLAGDVEVARAMIVRHYAGIEARIRRDLENGDLTEE